MISTGKFAVRAKVDGEIVAEANLMAAMRMPDAETNTSTNDKGD